jgi:hypothetical protein
MAMVDDEYLPNEYFLDFQDVLDLASFVAEGLAELTEDGKVLISGAWIMMCQLRNLNSNTMYDSVSDFFRAQAQDADIIPIERGKK